MSSYFSVSGSRCRAKRRVATHLLGALLAVATSTAWGEEDLAREVNFHIPAQPLPPALIQFSDQSGLQVMTDGESLSKISTKGVSGRLSITKALQQLLDGTGLGFSPIGQHTVAIKTLSSANGPAILAQATPSAAPSDAQSAGGRNATEKKTDEVPPRLPAAAAPESARGKQSSEEQPLEAIVVTAQKREERLIDVPQSVTVLSSEELAAMGATQLRDYASSVPGMSLTTAGTGYSQITLRGVTTGFDLGSTVGIYVDDVPYGSSSPFADGPRATLDAGLFDLERIEVLRGPQGTLYGASTMGGLLKYVTKRPDPTNFSGDAQAGVSATADGGVNYNVAAAVNVPIAAEKAALRASAFESHDGGYIDNLALNQKDVNRADVYGGRLDLLVRPTEALSVRLTGFLQDIGRDGEGTADYTFSGGQPYGALGQHRNVAEPFGQHFRLVSGTVAYDMQWASLTSISSYQSMRSHFLGDLTAGYAAYCVYGGYTCSALGYTQDTGTEKFTQEVRVTSKGTGTLEWLVGGFYTHENSNLSQGWLPYVAGVPVANNLDTYEAPSTFQEYAAFGDITWHLTRRFDVTGGIRYAQNDQSKSQSGSGLFGLSHPSVSSNDHVVTYLADARYHLNDQATAYLRYATGYRPGGPNLITINPSTRLPNGEPAFQSDRLQSYEGGIKADTKDHTLGGDLSIYYIDWSNTQITVVQGGFSNIENASGGATVRGAELTLTAHPFKPVTLRGSFAYQNAEISQAEPNLGAYKGETLPNVPHLTAAVNADCRLPMWEDLLPTVGSTIQHVGDREASFNGSTGFPQYPLPSYTTVDFRAGFVINLGESGPIDTQIFVHNAFDERGRLSAFTWRGVPQVAIEQPRTIGVLFRGSF